MSVDEVTKEDIEEALALLNGESSVTIEPARKRVVRHRGRMLEVEDAAFVKFSTAFKKELKDLGEHALKVFLYIGLSIGFETGSSHPGVRKIADETGMAQNTAIKAVQELEDKGFLEVGRRDGASNVYTPIRYISIGKSASPNDAVGDKPLDEPPQEDAKPPHENDKPPQSGRVDLHNQINQIKQELDKNLTIENAIFLGKGVTEEIRENQSIKDIAPKMFERALGFSKPLPWWSNEAWTEFSGWVCEEYSKSKMSFGEYNIWRNTPYTKGGMSNNRIRGFIKEFYDSWDMFMMSKPKEEVRPELIPYRGEDVSNSVPNPFKKPEILRRTVPVDREGSE